MSLNHHNRKQRRMIMTGPVTKFAEATDHIKDRLEEQQAELRSPSTSRPALPEECYKCEGGSLYLDIEHPAFIEYATRDIEQTRNLWAAIQDEVQDNEPYVEEPRDELSVRLVCIVSREIEQSLCIGEDKTLAVESLIAFLQVQFDLKP